MGAVPSSEDDDENKVISCGKGRAKGFYNGFS